MTKAWLVSCGRYQYHCIFTFKKNRIEYATTWLYLVDIIQSKIRLTREDSHLDGSTEMKCQSGQTHREKGLLLPEMWKEKGGIVVECAQSFCFAREKKSWGRTVNVNVL